MARSEGYIRIFCDIPGCSNEVEFELCSIVSGNNSWDDRNINQELENMGWLATTDDNGDDVDYCDNCVTEMESLEESNNEE